MVNRTGTANSSTRVHRYNYYRCPSLLHDGDVATSKAPPRHIDQPGNPPARKTKNAIKHQQQASATADLPVFLCQVLTTTECQFQTLLHPPREVQHIINATKAIMSCCYLHMSYTTYMYMVLHQSIQ